MRTDFRCNFDFIYFWGFFIRFPTIFITTTSRQQQPITNRKKRFLNILEKLIIIIKSQEECKTKQVVPWGRTIHTRVVKFLRI